jgi:hypothetical protein
MNTLNFLSEILHFCYSENLEAFATNWSFGCSWLLWPLAPPSHPWFSFDCMTMNTRLIDP